MRHWPWRPWSNYIAGWVERANVVPTVFIDGLQTQVTLAGRSPQYTGLDQINIQVPNGTRRGVSVPVVIVSGGRASNSVVLYLN
jgi:uncharacterized protein (TIGR03437 family)